MVLIMGIKKLLEKFHISTNPFVSIQVGQLSPDKTSDNDKGFAKVLRILLKTAVEVSWEELFVWVPLLLWVYDTHTSIWNIFKISTLCASTLVFTFLHDGAMVRWTKVGYVPIAMFWDLKYGLLTSLITHITIDFMCVILLIVIATSLVHTLKNGESIDHKDSFVSLETLTSEQTEKLIK